MELFPESMKVGVFRGFREGGMEFHADIALPYKPDMHTRPMHGSFILVRLENENEAVLGRVTSFASEGRLSATSGEDFTIRAVQENRDVPEDLREQYLKYRVNIRVLGVLRLVSGKLTFVPSHRRLPHVGSPVAFPSDAMLQDIAGHNDNGVVIGNLALGEYVYDPTRKKADGEDWMQLLSPQVDIRFDVSQLISRRSFVFARAGFGKSNLNKLLFSELYREQPEADRRAGEKAPVGTIVFDPDGEYFWPDFKGRPGLCDVPWLQDKLVVFTSREAPSAFYGSFTASKVRLDIRELRPSDVISIALPPERQDQQNVSKLRSMSSATWRQLVDLIYEHRNNAPLQQISALLNLQNDIEAVAARSNMSTVVGLLHDPSSQLMARLFEALSEGKLCVVDMSQMRGTQGFILAGIILRQIFTHNQTEFTKQNPKSIPTIAVVEEAQSVLHGTTSSEPFVSWVKEGRKYDLGAVLITQQPGSIPNELLSQGDNWFIFHLLSASDLQNVRTANAHFSNDILSSLLNEPIKGQGIFWSSAAAREYPIPVRISSFEALVSTADPNYDRDPVATFAQRLRERSETIEAEATTLGAMSEAPRSEEEPEPDVPEEVPDVLAARDQRAANAIRADADLVRRIKDEGVRWATIQKTIAGVFENAYEDAWETAYKLVVPAVTLVFGERDRDWETYRHDGKLCIRAKRA